MICAIFISILHVSHTRSLCILGDVHQTTRHTYSFILLALLHSHLLTYLQFRPCTSAEDLTSPLQTLFGFFDHIIDNFLGGFDVLDISLRPNIVESSLDMEGGTYIDHGGNISHEPHPTLHGFLGMFLEFLVMRDLSFGCEFLAAKSAFLPKGEERPTSPPPCPSRT